MSRTIVLLDVTAMSADAVCVAGIDLANDQTVRLAQPQPTQRLIAALGGLAPGDIIKLDAKPLRTLDAPHVEDCEWNPRSLKKVGISPPAELRRAVESTLFTSVEQAFGEPVVRGKSGNSAWQPSVGVRSLATLSVLYVRAGTDRNERPRLTFKDDALDYWTAVPFQDLCVKRHQSKCDDCAGEQHVEHLKEEFDGNRTLIRVGLTRPFSPSEGVEPLCWLQVTNVFSKPRDHFGAMPPPQGSGPLAKPSLALVPA